MGGVVLSDQNTMNIRRPHLFQNVEYKQLKDVIVVDGACGYYHTVLLAKKRQIFGFGSNVNHAFSRTIETKDIHVPHVLLEKEIGIMNDEEIVRIIGGHQTTVFITRKIQ